MGAMAASVKARHQSIARRAPLTSLRQRTVTLATAILLALLLALAAVLVTITAATGGSSLKVLRPAFQTRLVHLALGDSSACVLSKTAGSPTICDIPLVPADTHLLLGERVMATVVLVPQGHGAWIDELLLRPLRPNR